MSSPDILARQQRADRRSRSLRHTQPRPKPLHSLSLAEVIALLPGRMRTFLSWLKSALPRDPSLKEVYDTFMRLPSRRQSGIELEELCLVMGVPPSHLFGAASEVAFEMGVNTAKALSAMAIPSVVERNVKEALKPKGVDDRRMFLQSTGILPTAHGSSINVNASAQAATLTADGSLSGLPCFEDDTIAFSEVIRNAVDLLPAKPVEPDLEVKVTDDEEDSA